jgi:transposase
LAGLTVSPHQHRIGFYFRLFEHNIRGPHVADFLRALHRHQRRPILLACDRYSVHRSAIRQLREEEANWLHVELLPPYSPDLNPVEALWSHTKYADLANFVPQDIDDLHDAVSDSFDDTYFNHQLRRSFFGWAGLNL